MSKVQKDLGYVLSQLLVYTLDYRQDEFANLHIPLRSRIPHPGRVGPVYSAWHKNGLTPEFQGRGMDDMGSLQPAMVLHSSLLHTC